MSQISTELECVFGRTWSAQHRLRVQGKDKHSSMIPYAFERERQSIFKNLFSFISTASGQSDQ